MSSGLVMPGPGMSAWARAFGYQSQFWLNLLDGSGNKPFYSGVGSPYPFPSMPLGQAAGYWWARKSWRVVTSITQTVVPTPTPPTPASYSVTSDTGWLPYGVGIDGSAISRPRIYNPTGSPFWLFCANGDPTQAPSPINRFAPSNGMGGNNLYFYEGMAMGWNTAYGPDAGGFSMAGPNNLMGGGAIMPIGGGSPLGTASLYLGLCGPISVYDVFAQGTVLEGPGLAWDNSTAGNVFMACGIMAPFGLSTLAMTGGGMISTGASCSLDGMTGATLYASYGDNNTYSGTVTVTTRDT